jgi:autotransporter-associated beta strand protein
LHHGAASSFANFGIGTPEHDLKKVETGFPVFRKDHAQTKGSGGTISFLRFDMIDFAVPKAGLFFSNVSHTKTRRDGGIGRSVAFGGFSTLAAVCALAGFGAARAQDATWLAAPASSDWNTSTNWTPAVPTGTAFFGTSKTTTVTFTPLFTSINQIQFNAGAPAYTFGVGTGGVLVAGHFVFTGTNELDINGNGIINNSANRPTFLITSTSDVTFNSGTAANAIFNLSVVGAEVTELFFKNSSTAGNATIVETGTALVHPGITLLNGTSSAGNATINNGNFGQTFWGNSATAGSATITNDAGASAYASSVGASTDPTVTGGAPSALSVFQNSSTGATAHLTNQNAGLTVFQDASTAVSATIANNSFGVTTFRNTASAGSATIANTGSGAVATALTQGNVTFPGVFTVTPPSLVAAFEQPNNNAGVTQFTDQSTAANATIANNLGGVTVFGLPGGTDTASAGSAVITNNAAGATFFFANTTASGATLINNASGIVDISGLTAAGTSIGSLSGAGTTFLGSKTLTLGNLNGNDTISGVIADGGLSGGTGGSLVKVGTGTLTLSGLNTYTGLTTVSAGTLALLGGGSIAASSDVNLNANTGTFDISATASGATVKTLTGVAGSNVTLGAGTLTLSNASGTFAGTIGGGVGGLTLAGGTEVLSGVNNYTGMTMVNGGTLTVDGSIASSGLTVVNAAGVLGGSGTLGNTTVTGGTLAPGSVGGSIFGPLTVQGSLAFTAASTYLIQVSPANAGRTNVTGAAALNGATVSAMFLPGSFVDRQYIILNATGGVSGTFNPAVLSNLASLQSTLSYDAKDVFLNIQVLFSVPGSGLNVNQQNVANALTNFFNTNNGIPVAFAALNAAGLTIASGELPTAAQQTTFDAMNLFLGLLTDPFVAGRGDGVTPSTGASQYAEKASASAYAANGKARSTSDAYDAIQRKAPLSQAYEPRWSVWAAGFGGAQTTDGNAALGSNAATSRIAGTAVGADYRFSPFTLAGFALAGGGTNFSLANGLGSGRSDLFQAGAFIRHTAGPAYISGALAYGWQDISTDRTVALAGIDRLHAEFNANAFSGRVEGGYRFLTAWTGITPYAAAQFTFEGGFSGVTASYAGKGVVRYAW